MTEPANSWRCTGAQWTADGPGLGWTSPRHGERQSPLLLPGGPLAFAVTGGRRCVGVPRAGRRVDCPTGTEIPPSAANPLCPACAAVDRRHSVAADTALDDPQPYRLYLAWFGPGLVKIGITAAGRGDRRLLGQGALVHTWLGEGALPGVRRAERVLGTALGLPDRMAHAAKAAARSAAPLPAAAAAIVGAPDPAASTPAASTPATPDPAASTPAASAPVSPDPATAELQAAHRAAHGHAAWPDTVARLPFTAHDHTAAYHFDRARPPRPDRLLSRLAPGATVAGTLAAIVGPDAYLCPPGTGPLLLVDLRLLAGWQLTRTDPAAPTTAPTVPFPYPAVRDEPPALF